MTCPSLVRRAPAPLEAGVCLRGVWNSASRAAADVARRRLSGDAPGAQLARFVLAGALATSVQVVLFTVLSHGGPVPAHVVSWGVSTALANELHRRRTFRAGGRVRPLTAQLQGGGLALLGLVITTAALGVLTATLPDAGVAAQALLVLGVTAAVGLLRFAGLRWTFVLRRPHEA